MVMVITMGIQIIDLDITSLSVSCSSIDKFEA